MRLTGLLSAFATSALVIFQPLQVSAAPPDGKILLLAPSARIEQRCNARAMGVIGREHRELKPDELVAYAFADTVIKDATIRAPGAAVRSGGKWFRLSYSCETADDGTSIVTFQYKLGALVPRAQWDAHYLVP